MKNCWPVSRVGDRVPVISQEFKPNIHLGVDIMFRRISTDPPMSDDDPRGTKNHFCPDEAMVLACADGYLVYAKWAPNGFRVRMRHESGFDTISLHLRDLRIGGVLTDPRHVPSFLARALAHGRMPIDVGTPLGLVGGDPTQADPRHRRHDHFEMRRPVEPGERADEYGKISTDPARYLREWTTIAA